MSDSQKCERCREYNAAAVDYRNQATRAQDDYAALLTRHNALEERIRRLNVWHECDKCECLFVPGGLGAETSCATCIKRELDALREAVKKEHTAFDALDDAGFQLGPVGDSIWTDHAAARAEVDRIIAEEASR